ncbi:MAG TPA: KTSC domain-containing protein [Ohtaekwangia sp.]|uniref:KTSC domain-containing protein n=1 Tax=Ohtaekwangia sp. TaxID=2066019 RepID=UPI002F9438EC
MLRTPVTSSGLASIGYDEDHAILEVEFTSGEVYQYLDVPLEVYEALMSAESHGTYFSKHIRPLYDFRHVEE